MAQKELDKMLKILIELAKEHLDNCYGCKKHCSFFNDKLDELDKVRLVKK